MKPLLEIDNISKIYQTPKGETVAIEGFSLDVFEGEFISIVGPSGCGKSSILSLIAGLSKLSSGEIRYNFKQKTMVGYMLQNDFLFSWRSILKNSLLGLEIKNLDNLENVEYVKNLLFTYGLGNFIEAYPNELSGGMRQRVALIRTLALKPEILLLDEPFSALDYQSRLAVSDDISNIIRKENKTAILVTHDLAEAISMSDRVVVLTNRPSTVKEIYEIKLSCDSYSSIEKRKASEFSLYYDKIWKDLDVHV